MDPYRTVDGYSEVQEVIVIFFQIIQKYICLKLIQIIRFGNYISSILSNTEIWLLNPFLVNKNIIGDSNNVKNELIVFKSNITPNF